MKQVNKGQYVIILCGNICLRGYDSYNDMKLLAAHPDFAKKFRTLNAANRFAMRYLDEPFVITKMN